MNDKQTLAAATREEVNNLSEYNHTHKETDDNTEIVIKETKKEAESVHRTAETMEDEKDLSVNGVTQRKTDNNREEEINGGEEEEEEEVKDLSAHGLIHRKKDNKKEEEMQEGDEEEEHLAPDGGWGWVVVVGASLILVLVDTVGQCFGIIFSTLLLELEAPSAMTAWIFNMFGFLWCMTGPPLGPLVAEFGWRRVTFVGSIMLTLSTVTSAFVTSPWELFFTYSALGGIGCGIISNISYMIVPYYFSKRRGLANGIIMSWDCGGQLLGPLLIQYLQTVYGFTGSNLILGGVVLHCCVGAMVFHPVKWHTKKSKREVANISKDDKVCEYGSNLNQNCSSSCISRWMMMTRLARSTLADLRVLRSARAVIIALGATFMFNGYLNFLAFVPFSMQLSGFTLQEAAWCVSVSGMCNMLTRIVVSTLTDTYYFNFRLCYLTGSFTIAATMIMFVTVREQVWLAVVMGVWGCGVGAFMSIFNLVMVHYMGLDNFMPMLGATMLCIAGGYLTIGPCVGYIRDASGSYLITIWVLAFTVIISFFLWLFMPAAVAYDKRKSAENEVNNKYNISVI
ncbi:monocarboxylate transporter 12-B-like isoform X2 [Homarus americanus]|nr:monocarboxylate transporter 12-B-like isoform X2 [Homarus americanus]XP_042228969.1 monocarboxylate transporter 12-B-like isoform X2 [Homarus americanus]XP_042228970.1 monocarboxylate transporter 12-B-like isoform X2 [Homarus americanus]XP_042228971.1 monocarboxylate transporter 12-B-like isoform X2 [Homarus americanus]XP_042228972.1 monocarboxylate transporter 12-B-like isoform X2 [Homarus americanus]XP_042228973.1 monocarboxylate transporter 12-B-like isoform X2 [Homarus americanus]XP_04